MAISRAQLAKELEPGLNALFGMSYDQYDREYEDIFVIEDSNRASQEAMEYHLLTAHIHLQVEVQLPTELLLWLT